MANEEHRNILLQGVRIWNKWREDQTDIRPDLSEASLSGADLGNANLREANLFATDLREANLSNANLREANLDQASLRRTNSSGANLEGASLSEANLGGASLNGASLNGASLYRAYLRGANLVQADLNGANLNYADLNRADLSGAHLVGADLRWTSLSEALFGGTLMGNTILGDVDLSTVKGLETVEHRGPSTIGIDTIYRSQGKIPEVFLRGAGVPDSFITYMHSLTSEAIQYYTCFISYSTKDQDFATRLHTDLQAKGVRCWFAPEDIAGGKKIHEQIDQAIRLYDKLLVILSENSIASEWVKTEIYNARQQEVAENRRKLFPISLVDYSAIRQWKAFDADIGKDMAREVREYFIPDFTHWKEHDSYQKGFDRLLRDLKAET